MSETIKILAKKNGFRRVGHTFSDKTPTILKISDLTEDQLEQLKSDPMLLVGDVNPATDSTTETVAALKETQTALDAATTELTKEKASFEKEKETFEKEKASFEKEKKAFEKEKASFEKEKEAFEKEKSKASKAADSKK